MNAKTADTSFEIEPLGEYSLEESAMFIGAWHKAPEEGGAARGHLHLTFLSDRDWKPVGVCLTQGPDGLVTGEVYGDVEMREVKPKVARILSLDVDGRGWPEIGRRDQVVGRLQQMFPGFRPVNWSDAYEAAAWCLTSSRISMRQAQRIKDRMCRELGHEVDVHGHRLWTFLEPARLAELDGFQGLFGRKVEYLNALGRAALSGELGTDRLRAMTSEEALAALQRLPGIGPFGSHLVRLRALSAVDELPTQEPRLMAAVRTAYGLPREPDAAKLREVAEGWRPYRMWVAVSMRRMAGGGA
jgi:DNA-3-methyladenine glycosylase II